MDPLGELPNVVQGEEDTNDAYNASLLTAQKFVQEKLSSSSVTATAAASVQPHAIEHKVSSSSAPEAHERESVPSTLNQSVPVPHRPSVQVTANRNDLATSAYTTCELLGLVPYGKRYSTLYWC